jgi:cell division initiation protein
MFLTPPEIQHQTLKSGRGYDREAVDELLEHVSSSYEQVWLERDELRGRVSELEGQLASFRETERLLSETLITAQRAADDVRAGAEREAEQLKAEALAELEPAKAAARRELEGLRAEIERFRSLERDLRSNLRAFLERALTQVDEDAAGRVPHVETLTETLTEALAPQPGPADRDHR